MVNASGILTYLLLLQNIQQGNRLFFLFIGTLRLLCIFGNIPSLAVKKHTVYSSLSAVISNASFRHIPFFRYFIN